MPALSWAYTQRYSFSPSLLPDPIQSLSKKSLCIQGDYQTLCSWTWRSLCSIFQPGTLQASSLHKALVRRKREKIPQSIWSQFSKFSRALMIHSINSDHSTGDRGREVSGDREHWGHEVDFGGEGGEGRVSLFSLQKNLFFLKTKSDFSPPPPNPHPNSSILKKKGKWLSQEILHCYRCYPGLPA